MASIVRLIGLFLTVTVFLVSALLSATGQCSSGRYGQDCRFHCHCVTCDSVTGCTGNCDSEWDGPICQRQNVALKRKAVQSSTRRLPNSSGNMMYFRAEYAVDGIAGKSLFNTPCSHTDINHQTAYWRVTLDRVYEVFGFEIYNRQNVMCIGGKCGARLNGFRLSVGNTSTNSYTTCYQDHTTNSTGPGDVITRTCDNGITIYGDSAKILLNSGVPLTLCEVRIFACSPGTWGDSCEHFCGHCWNDNRCLQKRGVCPVDVSGHTCKAGYYGTQCNAVCYDGHWGPDCGQSCGHCSGNAACDKSSGVCPRRTGRPRCSAGYMGNSCSTECDDGHWGTDCGQSCGHCLSNAACDKSSGVCPKSTGHPRCSAGYKGDNCSTVCNVTRWGADCKWSCGHCWNNTACHNVIGVCPLTMGNPRCNAGYLGDDCSQRICPDKTYGPYCRYVCHCRSGVPCDPVAGCVGGQCSPGWDGDTCQRQNVALNQAASQSSVGSYGGKSYPAEYAVDGKVSNMLEGTPCTHTEEHQQTAEWNVTLTEIYSVYRFRIYNREEEECYRQPCGARLNNFRLFVGNSSSYTTCYEDNTTDKNGPGFVLNKVCQAGPLWGDRVRISLDTGNPLTLCEVQIFVCALGWYGETCEKECNSSTRCSRCDPGGIECTQCVQGSWGEDCENTCGNCWDKVCIKTNGTCVQAGDVPRCRAGYKGTDCSTKCSAGSYGSDCANSCGHCAEGKRVCNITSGECPARENVPTCAAGYYGKLCDQACGETDWGMSCTHKCAHCWNNTTCDRVTGECPLTEGNPRCSAGYLGEDCTQPCNETRWGVGCTQRCGNCWNNLTCDRVTGECPMSEEGFRCSAGYLGKGCTQRAQVDYIPVIAGSVAGVIVAAVGLVLLIFFLRRYHRRPQNRATTRQNQFVEVQENSVQCKSRNLEMEIRKNRKTTEENIYEKLFDRIYENVGNVNRESGFTGLTRSKNKRT